ncbi:DUF3710 domain-containing protein [Actinomyces sp. zg-332]|uniref:DUF3710 domain-containing protein n=1 Tax=Actinomyces sp. zg-332 TaxID=2708340 RepID=UPI00142020DB|nr:DUF3710 domain-containing protein [Actinomyces sp. zg-332]QPK94653.1 DUF3710 domain-containing protein [Actinomyces sp. zg-332]
MGIFDRFKKNKIEDLDVQIKEDFKIKDNSDVEKEVEQFEQVENNVIHGPYDISQAHEKNKYLNMGALRIPAIPDMQVIPDPSPQEGYYTSVTLVLEESALNLMVLSDSKSGGLWAELLELLSEDFNSQSANPIETAGRYGREIVATVTASTPDGRKGTEKMRFIGVEGPRWVLRAIVTGKAMHDEETEKIIENVFEKVIVDRGENPIPPGEILLLDLPEELPEMLQEKE